MLWHRWRYIWPFAGAWFVGIAQQIGDRLRRVTTTAAALSVLLPGVAAGALLMRLPGAVSDLAQSACAVDRRYVATAG